MTLFVASRSSGLEFLDAEIEAAANDLDADLCIAGADTRRITEALSRKRYKTLWLAGHGNEDGIWLADDCRIDANSLAPAIRDRGVELIILNSCNSARMAYELFAKTGATVVYTEASVQDEAAFSTAKRLATELAAGADYHTAFNRSRSNDFRMVPEKIKNKVMDSSIKELRQLLSEFDRRLLVLETKFDLSQFDNNKRGDKLHWAIIIAGLMLAAALFLLLSGNELL